MKKIIKILILLILLLNLTFADNFDTKNFDIKEDNSILKYKKTLKIGNNSYDYYYVLFNLKDDINIEIKQSDDLIGHLGNFKDFANEDNVLAVINGSFFDMNKDANLASNYIKNGNIEHISNYGSLFSFDAYNNLIIDKNIDLSLILEINENIDNESQYEISTINHYYGVDYDNLMIFTKNYDSIIPQNGHFILVKDEKVIDISSVLPEMVDGSFIVFSYHKILDVKIGDTIKLKNRYFLRDKNKEVKKDVLKYIKNGLGAGPTLVLNHLIVVDPKSENLSLSSFSKRSFIGIDDDENIALVVTDPMTFDDLAKVAIDLNLKDAIALDGGGSSAMLVGQDIIRDTNRKLSNVILVKKSNEPKIRIILNNEEISFDKPRQIADNYYVKIKDILKKIDVNFNENNMNKKIYVDYLSDNIVFDTFTGDMFLNSNIIKNKLNDDYISLEYIIKLFGGKYFKYEVDSKPVIKIDIMTKKDYMQMAKNFYKSHYYEKALDEFNKVLLFDNDNLIAIKYSAKILDEQFKDYIGALNYYKHYLALRKDDEIYEKAVKISIKLDDKTSAISLLEELKFNRPGDENVIFELAKLYKDIDNQVSKNYYDWIYKNAKSSNLKNRAIFELKKFKN